MVMLDTHTDTQVTLTCATIILQCVRIRHVHHLLRSIIQDIKNTATTILIPVFGKVATTSRVKKTQVMKDISMAGRPLHSFAVFTVRVAKIQTATTMQLKITGDINGFVLVMRSHAQHPVVTMSPDSAV